MNYRHRFHAGNVADVFKHLVLGELLGVLAAKETPLCVIDTHAGSGLYRLKAPGEFEAGIGRLWPVKMEWPALADYFASVAAVNGKALENYPGSPLLIARRLRAQDRAVFIEQHADEAEGLRDNLRGRPRIAIHEGDGFAMLKALVPPPENRGLVFIDPPYENTDEFARLAGSLTDACRRWRNGLYAIWYPIKARPPVERLHAAVRRLGATALAVELLTLPEDVPQRLNGSGILLVNPPWKLEEKLGQTLSALAVFLAGKGGVPQTRFIDLTGERIP